MQLALKMFDIGMENEYKENKRNNDPTRNTCLKMLHRRHTDPKPNRILMSNTILVTRSCLKFKFIINIIQIPNILNIWIFQSELMSTAQKRHIIRTISNEFNMKTNEIFIEYDLSFSLNISMFPMFSMLLLVDAM